jgi:Arc/MetJ family transcription regulator
MIRRTTVEIDEDLLVRAKRALGAKTTRAAIEEALRWAVEAAEGERAVRAAGQRRYLRNLASRADLTVLKSAEMWQ